MQSRNLRLTSELLVHELPSVNPIELCMTCICAIADAGSVLGLFQFVNEMACIEMFGVYECVCECALVSPLLNYSIHAITMLQSVPKQLGRQTSATHSIALSLYSRNITKPAAIRRGRSGWGTDPKSNITKCASHTPSERPPQKWVYVL